MNKRRSEISLLNVVLCMMVIFIHLTSLPLSEMQQGTPEHSALSILWRLAACVVQGFIFLSGLKTFLGGREEKSASFILKRVKTVFLPYLIWVCVYYAYFLHEQYFDFSVKDLLYYMLFGDLAAHFYFIVIIMQFYILYPLWKQLINRAKPLAALIISAALTIALGIYLPDIIGIFTSADKFPYLDRAFTLYLIYWVAGMYAGRYYDKFIGLIKEHSLLLTVVFVIAAAGEGIFAYLRFEKGIIMPQMEIYHVLYCFAAIFFGFAVTLRVRCKENGFLMKTDRASYYIYLVHILIIFILDRNIIPYLGITSNTARYALRFVIVYAASITLCRAYCAVKSFIRGKRRAAS